MEIINELADSGRSAVHLVAWIGERSGWINDGISSYVIGGNVQKPRRGTHPHSYFSEEKRVLDERNRIDVLRGSIALNSWIVARTMTGGGRTLLAMSPRIAIFGRH